jgi:hypothetical protein
MAGDWDDSLKMLVNDNSQDFVTWLFKGAKPTRIGLKEDLPCWMRYYETLQLTRKF